MKYNRFIQTSPDRKALGEFMYFHSEQLAEFLQFLELEYTQHVNHVLSTKNINDTEPLSVIDFILVSFNGFALGRRLLNATEELYTTCIPDNDVETLNQVSLILSEGRTDIVTENVMVYELLFYVLTPTERLQFKTLDRDTITSRQLNLELRRLQTIIKHIISLT